MPTHRITLPLLTFASSSSRADRAVRLLRDSRAALAAALRELEERHPDDAELRAQIAAWRQAGGVPFPP